MQWCLYISGMQGGKLVPDERPGWGYYGGQYCRTWGCRIQLTLVRRRQPTMSDHHENYRLRLNNWLASRGWANRFTWDHPESDGPNHDPTWLAVGRCLFRFVFSPRLLDSYLRSTVDGNEYCRGEGKTLARAKEEAARIALRRLIHEFDSHPTTSTSTLDSTTRRESPSREVPGPGDLRSPSTAISNLTHPRRSTDHPFTVAAPRFSGSQIHRSLANSNPC